MSRYFHSADDVPKGLSIPHWSWDGLRPYRYDFIWSDPAFECQRKTEFSSPVTSDRDVEGRRLRLRGQSQDVGSEEVGRHLSKVQVSG